jgi:hypothetical protein
MRIDCGFRNEDLGRETALERGTVWSKGEKKMEQWSARVMDSVS